MGSTDLHGESTHTPGELPKTQTPGELPAQTQGELQTHTPDEPQLLIEYLEKLLHTTDEPESPTQTPDSAPTENPAELERGASSSASSPCIGIRRYYPSEDSYSVIDSPQNLCRDCGPVEMS